MALRQHAPSLDEDSIQSPPRIIIKASEFGPSVSSTVVFLRQTYDVDIRLVRFQAYRTKTDELLVTASQIFPPPEIEDFMLFPDAEIRQERRAQRQRETNTVTRLLDGVDGWAGRAGPPVPLPRVGRPCSAVPVPIRGSSLPCFSSWRTPRTERSLAE